MKDIFERDLTGEAVSIKEQDYIKIKTIIRETASLVQGLNTGIHTENECRKILSKIIGKPVDDSIMFVPPFYCDFGKNITLGKNVIIQNNCIFMDRGGITIGDNVFIAPKVNLVTINHDINPRKRDTTYCKSIVIEDNVWIGINSTILPGVKIGKNSIVGAGSVVTKDVEPNTIVAGNPAKFIKNIPIND